MNMAQPKNCELAENIMRFLNCIYLIILVWFCNSVTQLSSVKFVDDDFVWPCQPVGQERSSA